MRLVFQLFVGSMLLVCAAGVRAATPEERVLMIDAVHAAAGEVVEARAELFVMHEGIEYHFATPQNKEQFEKSPARFEVHDGGACGRMGPLSGMGDARRCAVHEGRIFFFASDGCRKSFLQDPWLHIEADDPKPDADAAQAIRGRELLDTMVAWAGGADAIGGIKTYRQTASRVEQSGGKDWSVVNIAAARFPDCFMTRESWNESWFSTIRSKDGAAMASKNEHEPIAASRARAFDRSMARSILTILKAHVDAEPAGSRRELVAIYDGSGRVGETAVDFVSVWLCGARSRLAIEPVTGRPVQCQFRGRDGTTKVGDVARNFTAYKTIGGVQLPTAYTVEFNGTELASAGVRLDAFEINLELPADTFALTKVQP